jgi:hypothetical protein
MDKHVRDLDAERLFVGVSAPDPDEPLTRFTADVRATFAATPAEPTRAAHLHAMIETYAGLVGAPAPAPAPTRRRRRFVVRGTIAAAGLVLLGGSAMAATGTLPDVAQDAVSRVADVFGVKIPRAHPTDTPTLNTDFDHPDLQIEVTDHKRADDDSDDHVSRDDDADSDDGPTVSSTRDRRRPRREAGDSGGIDGGSSTPTDPSNDDDDSNDSVIDDRGDPSDGVGDGGGGSDPAPDDGDGDPDPDDGGDPDPDDGGRGDPKDGAPGGAESSPDDPASDPAGGD